MLKMMDLWDVDTMSGNKVFRTEFKHLFEAASRLRLDVLYDEEMKSFALKKGREVSEPIDAAPAQLEATATLLEFMDRMNFRNRQEQAINKQKSDKQNHFRSYPPGASDILKMVQ